MRAELHTKERFTMKLLCAALLAACACLPAHATPRVLTGAHATPRELYAAERLRSVVADLPGSETIVAAQRNDRLLHPYDKQLSQFWPDATEAFLLRRLGNVIIVAGFDASGTLYGALDLSDRIAAAHAIPATLDYEDHPQLKLRGTAIGMQKPEITYQGAEYDYPYTPKDFPFFYDKAWWTRYLDMLVDQRYNALFLWNGHPFTSLLRLPKYPEAQEISDAQLKQNIAMFRWITEQADRRGIWVLQGFYNIHLSHSLARAHGLPYHLSTPTPLSAAYTRYCIGEFIRHYPNVGIFMTLGEAMGPHYGPQWMTEAILPGVKDGLAALAKQAGHPVPQPPIVVRAHATDIDKVMAVSRPLYSNINTMFKWNGESLTWTNVRGPVRAEFERLVDISSVTIANIHLLSDLEPFRWGDPDFVRQTVLNFVRIGIGGVHVYPLRYWDWPVSADKATPLLQQTTRDWVWFDSWGRYAWNPDRDPTREHAFWVSQFAERFGTDQAGEHLLDAYELAGICSPTLLPRIGITEGNREVLSLGMTMPQLIDPQRFNPAQTLWTGDAPEGERLDEYVSNEVRGLPQHGETPLGVVDEVVASSAKAVEQAEAAAPGVTRDAEEYKRIVNDMQCIHDLMLFYQAKTKAAEQVLLFGYDHNFKHLSQAETLLATSMSDFRQLAQLGDAAYRNVAGMETSQRQIPVRGAPNTNHWSDLLPVYEQELTTFRSRLQNLQATGNATLQALPTQTSVDLLPQVSFKLEPGEGEIFKVTPGEALYSNDVAVTIASLSPELNGLTGIRVSTRQSAPLHFTLSQPAQILVGFLRTHAKSSINISPAAEQWNILLPDALMPSESHGRPLPINVWAKPLPAGRNDLNLGVGSYVVVGFIPASLQVAPHIDVHTTGQHGQPPNLDWLFEN